MTETKIRKAAINDVKQIQALVNSMADKDLMLPRSLNQIYESIRDYYICEIDTQVIGCAALHVMWENLAEVRSVVVNENYHGEGIGKQLVTECLGDARTLGLSRVFALTYVPGFFETLGFSRIDKSELPHKIWSECINCPKFPDCNEEAVLIELGQ